MNDEVASRPCGWELLRGGRRHSRGEIQGADIDTALISLDPPEGLGGTLVSPAAERHCSLAGEALRIFC